MTDDLFTLVENPEVTETTTPAPQPPAQPAPEAPAPEKKRGRPKGSTKQAGAGQSTTGQKKAPGTSESDFFNDLKTQVDSNAQAQAQAAAPQMPATAAQEAVKQLVDGYIVILFLDVAMPEAIKFIFKKKFEKVPISAIRLSQPQKESLTPLADEMAKYLVQYIDPLSAFVIVTGLMYYQNANDFITNKKP